MEISTFVVNSVLMNRKRYHGLEWSLYLKLIVGAVVVRVVVGVVKPPDNVWIMETVIA